jgi:hypothetical protein
LPELIRARWPIFTSIRADDPVHESPLFVSTNFAQQKIHQSMVTR